LIRSFLAIEVSDPVLKRIEKIQEDFKSSDPDVRWVNPDKIHLTLKFFGDIEESQIDSILNSIETPVHSTQPFQIKVRGTGAFPNPKNPRVVWVGLTEGKETLSHLQKELESSLEKIGFQPEDRSFNPHLTLGRVKSSRGKGALAAKIEKYREEEFGEFQVERVILFKSELTPSGPVYTALKEAKLGG
jgi:RNA 2',3'-cyclic 3'-phosphodiesterase